MKVALVYDRVNKWGGAERVLLALHEIWPEAPLYTAVYDESRAPWARVFDIRTSFLQHIPLAKTNHELYPWLTPMAFESFNFDEFDAVVSVTSAEAKGIITKPKTTHICYCLTPTRYLWSGRETYEETPGLWGAGLRLFGPTLRKWDKIASTRPDHYVAISNHVKERIERYYQKKSGVIYPPVEIRSRVKPGMKKGKYFLTVSRLVSYKRIDIIIQAFNKLGWTLIIIGDGMQKNELRNLAGQNITFIDRHLTDEELVSYYRNCRAFVWAGIEDFGIAVVEAQALGKPVIALGLGGISEIVKPGETGILFGKQTVESLINALQLFQKSTFSPEACRVNADRFNKQRFQKEFKNFVSKLIKT